MAEGLLTRTVALVSKTAKDAVAEVEKRLGKPVSFKKRAALRAAVVRPMADVLLKRDPEDGIVPFAAARTRTILASDAARAVGRRTRTVARTDAKGLR